MENEQNKQQKKDQDTIKEEVGVGRGWIDEELKKVGENSIQDRLPGLKLEENKIAEIVIDFSQPFQSWQDVANNTVKKIMPVLHEGVKKSFWMNCANPVYHEILALGKSGVTKFKILRTGQAKATRYTIIKD